LAPRRTSHGAATISEINYGNHSKGLDHKRIPLHNQTLVSITRDDQVFSRIEEALFHAILLNESTQQGTQTRGQGELENFKRINPGGG
ncbi:MAG: hypothetical protein ACK4UN_14110, partial [Limisphaerales bacterium]